MKFLHTADWHLGKVLKGVHRLDEQRVVLDEVVAIAAAEQVDAVLVAGDVFDTAAPTADAQALAWEVLLGLRATGAEVVVVAGNHDHGASFEAVAPLCRAAGVTVLGQPHRPADGGVVELRGRDGEVAVVAALPFVSQRGIVRAAELLGSSAAEQVQLYADRYRRLVGALCSSFHERAVNVLVAHATIAGGLFGGGEREAQSVFDYAVPATVFPPGAHYVALGHLHRVQKVAAASPAWYPGSPIAVDFGEGDDTKGVLVVEASAGRPALVREVALRTPRRLAIIAGTFDELRALAGTTADAYLRVRVQGMARVGLADDVRELFPLALEVRVERAGAGAERPAEDARARSPQELFVEFCHAQGVDDGRLGALFADLLADLLTEEA